MRLKFCLVAKVANGDWIYPIRIKVLASCEESALIKCSEILKQTGNYHYILGGCESRPEIQSALEIDYRYVEQMYTMRKIREIGMHSPRAQRLRTKLELMKRRSFVL